jgi:predicted RNA binding protein YcfA (HicA-like mRNA interferase family)
MARRERRIERLRRSQTDVSPEQLRSVLEGAGFTLERIRGSHFRYSHPALNRHLIIPYRKAVLPVYVRDALKALDEVMNDGNS